MIKRNLMVLICLFFFVSNVCSANFNFNISPQYSSNTLYVGGSGPGNYTRIQYAIDNATNGDTVFVFVRTYPYFENLIIDKSIILMGEDKYSTVIDGNNQGNTINIKHEDVQVTGFTITNGNETAGILGWYIAGIRITASQVNIKNNIITNNRIGVFIKNSEELIIENNSFINDCLVIAPYDQEAFYTPFIEDYFRHTIANNTVNGKPLYYQYKSSGTIIPSNVGQVILVSCQNMIIQNTHFTDADFAIILINCTENIIRNNALLNGPAGLLWLLYSNNNQLLNNTITNNLEGICLDQASSQNIISNNILDSNSHINLMIESRSNHNKIQNNNIIGITNINAYLLNSFQTSFQNNHWGDHTTKLPKIIRGELTPFFLPTLRLPWFGIDWNPNPQPNIH